jgi:hypothetical protein
MASSELAQQLDLVRKVAHSQLATFARLDAAACKESYLFKDDHFCGIKIALGSFQARWEVGHASLMISRGAKVLQTVSLDAESFNGSSQRRAA